MLILTRKSEQSILIGEDIEIMILAVHRASVQIGIQAPREIAIVRTEIAERRRPATRPGA